MLTMAVVIPTTGFLLQRLSTRTVFVLAMGLFCAGTLLAALSPGFWLLLPARIVQASGTAMMIPLLMTTVLTLVPIERRGVVMGNISIAISVAPAIGPTISGLILQFLSWRFMFVLVLPIALAALAYGAAHADRHRRARPPEARPALGAAVGARLRRHRLRPEPARSGVRDRQLGRHRQPGGRRGLPAGLRRTPAPAGPRRRQPAARPAALRIPDVQPQRALLCVAMLSLFGMIILLPIYLQTVRGIGSLATGLMLLPGGLLMGLLGPTVGKIFDRYGPKALSTGGAAVLTFTLWRFSTVDATTPIWMLVGLHVLMMLALACLFTPCLHHRR